MTLLPTFYGYLEDEIDALLLLQTVIEGRLMHINRRPYEVERPNLILSGNIFVFVEEFSKIKRWTDGVNWSPSRVLGKFLIYREVGTTSDDNNGGGFKNNSVLPRSIYTGFTKRTISMKYRYQCHPSAGQHNNNNSNNSKTQEDTKTIHLVSYYNVDDVKTNKLLPLKKLDFFRGVIPSTELLRALDEINLNNNKVKRTSMQNDSHDTDNAYRDGNYRDNVLGLGSERPLQSHELSDNLPLLHNDPTNFVSNQFQPRHPGMIKYSGTGFPIDYTTIATAGCPASVVISKPTGIPNMYPIDSALYFYNSNHLPKHPSFYDDNIAFSNFGNAQNNDNNNNITTKNTTTSSNTNSVGFINEQGNLKQMDSMYR